VTPEQDTKQAQSPAADQAAGDQPVSEEREPAPHAPAPDEAAVAEGAAQDAVPEEPDYKDKWLRAVAELDNVRKRARREAIAQQPVDGAEAGTIVEVYSAGYTYGEDVLRPAKVVVAG
jgi:molecular chaperone GrpE (heat shock protein)